MKIIINTLRRSGSTVFWEAFRNNPNLMCYDEPFNPTLSMLPADHRKGVYKEYIKLIDHDARAFWSAYAPINPVEECKTTLSENQVAYLRHLLESSKDVVIDTTRCWNKTESLKKVLERYNPDIFFIYLYRDPKAFVSSHMLPSEVKSWRVMRNLKKTFWTRHHDYNYWKMEEVIGQAVGSAFQSLVMNKNGSENHFYSQPAYRRLLSFWELTHNKMKAEGQQFFGGRFIMISFEEFCTANNKFIELIKSKTGLDLQANTLDIRPPSMGFQPTDLRWNNSIM